MLLKFRKYKQYRDIYTKYVNRLLYFIKLHGKLVIITAIDKRRVLITISIVEENHIVYDCKKKMELEKEMVKIHEIGFQ